MTIGKNLDLDIGALVRLLFEDWDLDPLPPASRAHFLEAAAALSARSSVAPTAARPPAPRTSSSSPGST